AVEGVGADAGPGQGVTTAVAEQLSTGGRRTVLPGRRTLSVERVVAVAAVARLPVSGVHCVVSGIAVGRAGRAGAWRGGATRKAHRVVAVPPVHGEAHRGREERRREAGACVVAERAREQIVVLVAAVHHDR